MRCWKVCCLSKLRFCQLAFLASIVCTLLCHVYLTIVDDTVSAGLSAPQPRSTIVLFSPYDKTSSEFKSQNSGSVNKLTHRQTYKKEGLRTRKSENYSTEGSSHLSKNLDKSLDDCYTWCQLERKTKPPYFLTAVLLVRIYDTDKAKLTSEEMLQWLMYLRYAGVEHVYIYDAYVFTNESQRNVLRFFIDEDYVTYIDWHNRAFPYSIKGTQISAYQDCIEKWGKSSTWQTAIDIDEYPFSPNDPKPGFLRRFLSSYSDSKYRNQRVSQISMQNFLFLGKPLDKKFHPLLIDRILRRTPGVSNHLVKSIYRPGEVSNADVHRHFLLNGKISVDADVKVLRMNHYWGARLQNWGDDTPRIINMTIQDKTIKSISRAIKTCVRCFAGNGFGH